MKQQSTPEYQAWLSMRKRCNSKRCPAYKWYGGQGITIAPEFNSFAVFLAEIGPRPSRLFSLDRIDNDRGYEPGNIRWATRAQQAASRRRRLKLSDEQARDIFVDTRSQTIIARAYGVSPSHVANIKAGRARRRATDWA